MEIALSFSVSPANYSASVNFNSSTIRYGLVFKTPSSSNTLNGFEIVHGTNISTPTNAATIEVYASLNGYPTGSVLATVTYNPVASSTNIVTFSSPLAVTADTVYVAVWKNVHGTPTTNYYRILSHTGVVVGASLTYGVTSTNGGASYTNGIAVTNNVAAFPIYSNAGTIVPASILNSTGTSHPFQIYNVSGSRKARIGYEINCPFPFRIKKLFTPFTSSVGSPTYNLTAEICTANAVVSTSLEVVPGGFNYYFVFLEEVLLEANTPYFIVVTPSGSGNAGDSSNRRVLQAYNMNSLTPTGYIVRPVISTDVTPNFTSQANPANAFTVHIEPDVPAAIGGGGGGGVTTRSDSRTTGTAISRTAGRSFDI